MCIRDRTNTDPNQTNTYNDFLRMMPTIPVYDENNPGGYGYGDCLLYTSVSVMVPDKDGIMRDVVLGFDSIQDYIKYPSDFGASIGPVSYTHLVDRDKYIGRIDVPDGDENPENIYIRLAP